MTTANYAILAGTEYESSGGAETPRSMAHERWRFTMHHKSTPTQDTIPSDRQPYWSEEHQCYIVPFSRGEVALVDAVDLHAVSQYRWTTDSGGYAVALRKGAGGYHLPRLPMHRLIMAPGDGLVIDHINLDPRDNRRANLRACTMAQNKMNKSLYSHNKSGYMGVTRQHNEDKYRATLSINGKKVALGRSYDPIEAAIIRDVAALEVRGEFANLNFPSLVCLARPDVAEDGG